MFFKYGKIPMLAALLAAILLAISSCHQEPEDGDQYVSFTLHAGYADYDSVVIKLVDAASGEVYETVWNKKLPDPGNFPKHRLTEAKGKDFTIQIRGYNGGEVTLSKNLKLEKGTPGKPETVVADLRLLSLKLSVGELEGGFKPGAYAYTSKVGDDVATITVTAIPMDPGNAITIDGKDAKAGTALTRDLAIGPNFITVSVSRDGKQRTYEIAITRGRIVPAEEVTGVNLIESALTLYTGDPVTGLSASVTPPGALMEWISLDRNVVQVDGAGRLNPIGPGDAKVIVKAGNFDDTVYVKVKKDVPIIDAGQNIAVKPGTEVTFNVTLTQEHGTFVYFKYDLDGDGKADNADTANAPAAQTLKHTYSNVDTIETWFEAKDSEGNVARVTRIVTVDNGAYQIAITSPAIDTVIGVKSILIKYTVNGTALERSFSDLKEGPQTVTVDTGTGADRRTASRQVTVDTQGPSEPVFTNSGTSPSLKPTWAWKSGGGGGNGSFRASLDSAGLAVATPGNAAIYTPVSNLIPGPHTLYVQERDAVGNWSNAAKSTITIKVPDTTPPGAPTVIGSTPTPSAPKWTWTSGGGGIGIYKFKLADSTLAGAAESRDLEYILPGTPEANKPYVLYVAERDSAGNWSNPPGKFTITFDPSKPGVIILAPGPGGSTLYITSATVPFSGTAGGINSIKKVSYKINGVAAADADFTKPSWSIPSVPASENSATLVTIVATDTLNVTGEASLTLYYDKTKPGLPNITTTPTSPTKATKGAWAWTAGADNVNGSGLNGNYRWSLDGSTWTETQDAQVSDVAIPEGSTTFYLQQQDKALNWSTSATRMVVSDLTGPALSITTPVPNGTVTSIHVTATGTVSDALSGVASVSVFGQESGNGAVIPAGGNWTSGDLVLRGTGLDTLVVTATDAVGNTTVKTVVVTVNVAVPGINIIYPAEGMPYNLDTLTVRYTEGSGGPELKKLFTFTAATPEGSVPLEIVSTPNEAQQTSKKVVNIFRDKTVPTAPVLSPVKTPTNGTPQWTWTVGSDAGSGLAAPAAYRYQVNGAGAYTNIATAAYTHTAAVDGTTYSLVVQVMDKAGNWSVSSNSISIAVDKSPNQVSVTSPLTEYITNSPNISLVCKLNGTDQAPKPITLVNTGDTVNTLTCDYPDAAGNPASASIKVWYRPTVIFVRSGIAGGDGSSWLKPLSTIRQAMAKVQGGATRQIWVSAGDYKPDPGDTGLVMKSNLSLYGGFNHALHTSIRDRKFAAADTSYLIGDGFNPIMTIPGKSTGILSNITVDGFKFRQMDQNVQGISISYATGITLRRLKFQPLDKNSASSIDAGNSTILVDSCLFTGYAYQNIIRTTNTTLTLNNSTFTGNTLNTEGFQELLNLSGSRQSFTNTYFYDNPQGVVPTYRTINFTTAAGSMDFTNCTFTAKSSDVGLVVKSASPNVTYTGITWIIK